GAFGGGRRAQLSAEIQIWCPGGLGQRRRHAERARTDEREYEQRASTRGPRPGDGDARTGALRSHQPSSWWSNAIRPVNAPTSAGVHAAANTGINCALLRSSVTFE